MPSEIRSGTALWTTNTTLQTQLAGTGWQTARNVAPGTAAAACRSRRQISPRRNGPRSRRATRPRSPAARRPVLTSIICAAIKPTKSARPRTGSTHSLRARTLLLGDIVDASLTPVDSVADLLGCQQPRLLRFQDPMDDHHTPAHHGLCRRQRRHAAWVPRHRRAPSNLPMCRAPVPRSERHTASRWPGGARQPELRPSLLRRCHAGRLRYRPDPHGRRQRIAITTAPQPWHTC